MSSYGQYCPVAKAMELLDHERWTLLVVRELLLGSQHFNDLRRGVPKMSPALLSKRLQALTRAGIVSRSDVDGRTCYTLTQCGRELHDVVQVLADWGVRWMGELGDGDLDPHLLMWDMRRTVPIHAWPRTRTVVAFRLSGVAAKASSWWLMVADGQADICNFDPGYDVARDDQLEPAHADADLAGRRFVVPHAARRVGIYRRPVGHPSACDTDVDRSGRRGGGGTTGVEARWRHRDRTPIRKSVNAFGADHCAHVATEIIKGDIGRGHMVRGLAS